MCEKTMFKRIFIEASCIICNLNVHQQGWLNQLWHSHGMDYYTAIKKTTEAFYVGNGIEQSVYYGIKKKKSM